MKRRTRPAQAAFALALAAAILALGLAAATAQGQQPALQPIDFAANKFNIRHGTIFGRNKCSFIGPSADMVWESGWINERSREFRDIFLDAAKANAIPTPGASSSIFRSQGEQSRATYLVGSAVSRIHFDGCHDGNDAWKGTTTLTVDWEVYSPLDDRVVHREQVAGTFVAENRSTTYDLLIFIAYAYRDAANKLMRSAGFRQAITRAPGAGVQAVAPVVGERWLLPALQPFQAPLQQNIDYITNAAVTIDTGRGHGSGFFLTPDGWIMTNAHVARGNTTVKVILADGRSVFGQVVRMHDARDVALLKADGTGYPALPLRLYPVRLTEEVYAIGTPVDKKLRASVTRGIVSQFRTNERHLVDIQADVTTHGGSSGGPLIDGFGNVVGIAYAGAGGARSASGKNLGSGINFFIPIQDALDKLNLQLGVQ